MTPNVIRDSAHDHVNGRLLSANDVKRRVVGMAADSSVDAPSTNRNNYIGMLNVGMGVGFGIPASMCMVCVVRAYA
jgi:hypothetical protein